MLLFFAAFAVKDLTGGLPHPSRFSKAGLNMSYAAEFPPSPRTLVAPANLLQNFEKQSAAAASAAE